MGRLDPKGIPKFEGCRLKVVKHPRWRPKINGNPLGTNVKHKKLFDSNDERLTCDLQKAPIDK